MKNSSLRFPLTTVCIYAVVGGIWIVLSDRLLGFVATDAQTLAFLQPYKGWVFILGSAALLYALILREFRSHNQSFAGRNQAEDALRGSQDQYARLVAEIPVGVYRFRTTDRNGTRFEYVSPRFCEMLGVSAEEVYADAQAAFRTIHADDLDNFIGLAFEVLRTRKPFVWEGRTVAGGKITWLHVESTPELLENGDVVWNGIQTDISERMRGEEDRAAALKHESEARREAEKARALLLTVMERMSDGIVALDKDWRYAFVNRRGAQLLGRTPEQLIGRHIWTEFPEGVGQPFHLAYERAMREQVPISFERHYEPWDKWFENRIYPSPEGLTIFYSETTEKKKAEKSLRESDRQFQVLSEVSPVGIFRTDLHGDTTYVNPRWSAISGLSRAEALGVGWLSAVHKEDREKVLAGWEKAAKMHEVSVSEYRFVRPDGTIAWVIGQAVPERNSDNQIVGYTGTITDITDRKQVEEALQKSEDLYRAIFKNTGTATVLVDENTVISLANTEFEKLSKYSKPEIEGKISWTEFVRTEDLDRMRAQHFLRRENTEEALNQYEFGFITKEGNVRDILLTVDVIPGTNKSVASLLDITDRKRAEIEIQTMNAELEQRVIERTAQLEASNKELEAFSYSVSHDLRAPLRHMSGYVDLLFNRFPGSLPEKGEHYLHAIAESVRQMGALIDDLLEFSRTGRQEIRQTDLDMNNVLQEALDSIQRDNTGRNIEWVTAVLPRVLGDHALLRLVWLNLLSNAVKFTRTKEKAKIEIGVYKETKEYVFFVRDNGVGFDMQYSEKLFGVFQRLHSTEEFEGTGIGLANVRSIILRHGGRTWAEAEPDRGAAFYFTLPAHQEEKR